MAIGSNGGSFRGMDEKAVKKSISFPEGLLARADARAKAEYGNNLSRFVQVAIERALAGDSAAPAATDPMLLEHLFAAVLPSRVDRFKRIWDLKTKLGHAPAQAEVVESFLRAFLLSLEADPSATLADAFDSLPQETLAALVTAATTGDTSALAADPHLVRYIQPEVTDLRVAEDAPQKPRTARTLPLKPPKPPATGTSP